MVDIIFSNNKLHKRDSKLAENKKCPIQGILPDGLIVSIELDRVGLRNCSLCYIGIISNFAEKVNTHLTP